MKKGQPVVTANHVADDDLNQCSESQCMIHAHYVLQILQIHRKSGMFCDILVRTNDQTFHAHRSLLAACSLYFRSNLPTDPNNQVYEVVLPQVTSVGFDVLLNYMYTGILGINSENIKDVISGAMALKMTNVVETCYQFVNSSQYMETDQMYEYEQNNHMSTDSDATMFHDQDKLSDQMHDEAPVDASSAPLDLTKPRSSDAGHASDNITIINVVSTATENGSTGSSNDREATNKFKEKRNPKSESEWVESTSLSRKPRRTTGGQKCLWPGCGRHFRHRNIYEEHQRLHELGVSVTQLHKCYMGARVKKTVRQRLDDLRYSGPTNGRAANTSELGPPPLDGMGVSPHVILPEPTLGGPSHTKSNSGVTGDPSTKCS
uniref:Zinc finger protein n=1 Tax=Ciona intestinalis TaxID=7719 RepID=H2Y179_CIOIN